MYSAAPMAGSPPDRLLGLTAQIVAAHIGHTPVPASALPGLIRQVHAALAGAGRVPAAAPEKAAAPPRRTIYPDYLVCLEDGRKMKTLKRHLRSTYNMTPEQYREKWNLPTDYPMVAPSYAERRSKLARELGLGRRGGRRAAAVAAPAEPPAVVSAPEPAAAPEPALTASHVFARFAAAEPAPVPEPEPEPEAATAAAARKRQPFAQQRTRTMGR